MGRDITGPMCEPTFIIILLNGHNIKLSSMISMRLDDLNSQICSHS